MRDVERPDHLRPAASLDPGEAARTGASRVLLAPHGGGWRAESPHLYLWQETRADVEDWLRALAGAPRPRP